jgi:uncharacterized membrane protein
MGAKSIFWWALLAMALASYACRLGGYLLMRWIPVTPRIEAALRAIPLGVMVGIVTPAASSGRVPELAGLAVVALLMRLTGQDVVAALGGAAAVAVGRALGF